MTFVYRHWFEQLHPTIDSQLVCLQYRQMDQNHVFLPDSTLLRVLPTSAHGDHIYVLVFMPASTSLSSDGSFQVFDAAADQLCDMGSIVCSKNTAHCYLQDFIVIGDSICMLWDCQSQSMVDKTGIKLNELDHKGPPLIRMPPRLLCNRTRAYPCVSRGTPISRLLDRQIS